MDYQHRAESYREIWKSSALHGRVEDQHPVRETGRTATYEDAQHIPILWRGTWRVCQISILWGVLENSTRGQGRWKNDMLDGGKGNVREPHLWGSVAEQNFTGENSRAPCLVSQTQWRCAPLEMRGWMCRYGQIRWIYYNATHNMLQNQNKNQGAVIWTKIHPANYLHYAVWETLGGSSEDFSYRNKQIKVLDPDMPLLKSTAKLPIHSNRSMSQPLFLSLRNAVPARWVCLHCNIYLTKLLHRRGQMFCWCMQMKLL